jgi:hypothetical protein
MNRTTQILAAIVVFALSQKIMAATLTYGKGSTFGGWRERYYDSSNSQWANLAPDQPSLIFVDSGGDLRGFNNTTATTWLQSPEFILGGGGISFDQIYRMTGSNTAPSSEGEVSATQSTNGWAGLALINRAGDFVYTYSSYAVWDPVTFTAEELAPYVGQSLTLNIISMNNSNTDFFYVNRPITISVVPEPCTALLGLGGVGLLALSRRRTKESQQFDRI